MIVSRRMLLNFAAVVTTVAGGVLLGEPRTAEAAVPTCTHEQQDTCMQACADFGLGVGLCQPSPIPDDYDCTCSG
jgi:hypothetical protein